MMIHNKWTEDELNILKKYYKKEKTSIINRLPGRSKKQICAKAKKLGLSKKQNRYSYDEDKTICEKVLNNCGFNLKIVQETMDEFKVNGYKLRTLNSYISRFSNFNYLIYGVGLYGCSKQCRQIYKEVVVNGVV